MAILIPLAFTLGLPAETAMIMLTAVYAGAMYGGRISSILLNIPGVLPGAGASLGSFIGYTLEKKIVGKKGYFGKGEPRGVAGPEAGNNGASSGALVPMLTLGVPGSGTTAVLLALLIGNYLLLVLNIPLVGIFVKLLSVPPMFLLPIVTMIAFVGIYSYSISNTTFDLYFMVAFGV